VGQSSAKIAAIFGLLQFAACSSNKPTSSASLNTLHISGIGSVFEFHWKDSPNTSLVADEFKENLAQTIRKYDETFSDWSEDSELRQLEKAGLTHKQKASQLFLKGLWLSRKFYKETGGLFDVTVGAVYWKELERPVGTK
jgi:thiamine biosynthesis lipoprotein ApbE